MAYGNWGAWVYRDGERMEQWEDQTPYHEREYEPGYFQAFLRREGTDPHHAVLGQKDVRLCGYKSAPRLYLHGETVDLAPYVTSTYDTWTDSEGIKHRDADEWRGEVEGYRFRASFDTERLNMIDLELVEPDGTVWTARCGYCYGSGHMEEEDASEVVPHLLEASS